MSVRFDARGSGFLFHDATGVGVDGRRVRAGPVRLCVHLFASKRVQLRPFRQCGSQLCC
ncbi:hypothetical protein C7S13_5689 [Burkholderia cepacia]|nr:hypothetical protein [Burkholderia cepacia]